MYGIILSGIFSAITGVGLYFKIRKPAARNSYIHQNYLQLINFLQSKKLPQAERIGKHSYYFKINSGPHQYAYQLTEVDGRLIIVWTLESKVHGKRGKEWPFNKSYEQQKMFQEISSDLIAYEKTLFREN